MRLLKSNKPSINEIMYMRIHLANLAYAELDHTWNRKKAPYNTNIFYLIIDGEAEIRCNDQLIRMTPGNIYVIPSGSVGTHYCHNTCQKLFFYGEIYDSNGAPIPIAQPGCIVLRDRMDTIQKMQGLLPETNFQSCLALRIMMEQLLLEVMERGEEVPITVYSPIINRAIYQIGKKPHMSHTAVTLAKRLHTTPHNLRKLFAKELGTTITQHVTQKTLMSAKQDLIQTTLTIKEISSRYGFCDQYYFSRLFTAHFGISPSKYRKEQFFK